MNNDDELKDMNLPLPPPPASFDSQQNDLPPPPIIEETQNDLLPTIKEEPMVEELKMDIQEPITTIEEPPIMDTNFPTTESNIPLPEQNNSESINEEIIKSDMDMEELNQENPELPVPVPIVETPATEEVSDSSSSSPINSIKVEISKEKLDNLLTKISEETVNYLMLLTKFLERKREFNTDTEKIDKTIEDINKIKDEMIKVLTETELTTNGFDPSSGAQKSQYAEMILGALALTAAVSGGKRKKTKKQKKITKPSNTKKHNQKKSEHKTKINKQSIKKSTTKKNK
jgi:hypothetical protein